MEAIEFQVVAIPYQWWQGRRFAINYCPAFFMRVDNCTKWFRADSDGNLEFVDSDEIPRAFNVITNNFNTADIESAKNWATKEALKIFDKIKNGAQFPEDFMGGAE